MPCFHPLRAYTQAGGGVTFKSPTTHDGNPIDLPCGQCIGCRLKRADEWALRCVHEAQMHEANCFVTLTYSPENLPTSLVHRHFQLFIKRVRKHHQRQKIRFYMCGEYGTDTHRPHFHACLFGVDFTDRTYFSKGPSGDFLYTSPTLTKLWGLGHAVLGAVTVQSAGYCSRYIVAKVTGDLSGAHYDGRIPEYNKMSLKPGIGSTWVRRFRSDIFPRDYVVDADGRKHGVPRYYDKLNERHDADELGQVKATREARAARPEARADNMPSRLRAKEVVKAAATKQLIRPL